METIKDILGIKEVYEFREKILDVIFEDQKKQNYYDNILSKGVDLKKDFIRDLFQEEAAARKSFKQDYTPDCLCQLFFKLANFGGCVYDECAGTGSLLIPFINAGARRVTACEVSDAVIPLLLFNLSIRNVTGTVLQEDVTTGDLFKAYRLTAGERYSDVEVVLDVSKDEQPLIVSNPPYSLPWSGQADARLDGFAVPPKSKADYLFLIDIIQKLQTGGEALVLFPHGVLFRGQSEGHIRQQLIESGYLKAIIGLPKDMFMNTGIPTVLLHVKKDHSEDGIYVADASGFGEKVGKQNVLSDEKIREISDLFRVRATKKKVARLVPISEIVENNYNLNIPRYIDTYEPEVLPPLKDIAGELVKLEGEIRETEKELAGIMEDLVGNDYQNDVKELLDLWRG